MPRAQSAAFIGIKRGEVRGPGDVGTVASGELDGLDADSVSVAIEDVRPADWADKVYKPDILGGATSISTVAGSYPGDSTEST